jgi:hypothetical protein
MRVHVDDGHAATAYTHFFARRLRESRPSTCRGQAGGTDRLEKASSISHRALPIGESRAL